MGVYFMDYDFNRTIDNIRKLMTQALERFEEEVAEALLDNERFYAFRGEDALSDLGVRVQGMDYYLQEKYSDLVQVPTKQKLQRALGDLLEKLEELYVTMEGLGNEKQVEKFENYLVQLHQAFTSGKIIRNDFNSDEFEELRSTVGNFYLNSMPFDPMEHGYQELTNTCRQAQNRFEDRMDELNRSLQRYIDQKLNIEITVFLAEKEEMLERQEKDKEEIKQEITREQPEEVIEQDLKTEERENTSDTPETEKVEETKGKTPATSTPSEKTDAKTIQTEEQEKENDLPEVSNIEEQNKNDDDMQAQQLLAQEERIRELEQLIAKQEASIAEKNQRIVELEEHKNKLSETIDQIEQQMTTLQGKVAELTTREAEKDQEIKKLKEENYLLHSRNDAKDELITSLRDEIKNMHQTPPQKEELTNEEDLEQTYQLLHSFTEEQKQEFYKSSKSEEALEELVHLKLNGTVSPSHQELLDELILTLLDGRSSVTIDNEKLSEAHR